MKRWILFLPLFALFSCNSKKDPTWFSAQKADEYFKAVENTCNEDDGKLWGENIYGPVLYVDVKTRALYANVADSEGLLKARDGIYTGILPKERWISNTAIEYGGTLFAMVPVLKEENMSEMKDRTLHSLFHCFQQRYGLNPLAFNTRHLNDKNARLYLKLEWKALADAIKLTGDKRDQAIRDALIFRGARRELFPASIVDENKFENYEGLTTFTYMKMSTESDEELSLKILGYLNRIYDNVSYAFGYGFIHGALYAYLLDSKNFDFTIIKEPDFDLGKATARLYEIELPDFCRDVAGSLALNYDLAGIRDEEARHQEVLNEKMHRIVSTFMEKPVLILQMESPNFSFEPEDINSLDTLGTLYRKLRVSDNWGKVAVSDGGALLANDLQTLRVSASDVVIERNHISGEGWILILNDGWQVVSSSGNYTIRKQAPKLFP